MKLPDNVYNFLKWLAILALPALATFYGVIGKVWDIPHTAEIVTTVSAVATFIGTLIGISQYNINKEKKNGEQETTEDK